MRHLNRIVVVPGVFDILHIGHTRFLESAANLGSYVIASVLSDGAVMEKKGVPPVLTFNERREVVASLRTVDMVVCQEHDDITTTLKKLTDLKFQPSILVRSSQNESEHGLKYMKKIGGHIAILDYDTSISSTIIKERVNGNA